MEINKCPLKDKAKAHCGEGKEKDDNQPTSGKKVLSRVREKNVITQKKKKNNSS